MAETPIAEEALEVPLSAIEDAAGRLDGYVHRTPMLSSMTAAAWADRAADVRLADGLLYLKAEHLQKTGSFKARGMTNRIATLPEAARARGAGPPQGRRPSQNQRRRSRPNPSPSPNRSPRRPSRNRKPRPSRWPSRSRRRTMTTTWS